MSRRLPKTGFLSQLTERRAMANEKKPFTWKSPLVRPTAEGAPRWNSKRSPRTPAPTSDIPLRPSGEIDVAAVRSRVQTLSKPSNPPTPPGIGPAKRPKRKS